ncbi:2-oxoglutarate ferredoxin oxidoreductase subunit alpha [Catalinimonas alkaloidigena]|uniref:2-oxoglutarate ferredoxin oxidoreductase subunit alpha n=1 Tax=Catalinimonas alkaloidigena TaxID=1075417 RepID=A0A1G9AD42_9BACT|nr:2-oxoacid:acceptor oxidoreductase subunit alpha [Catalinimonas alkaloidigena]SDK25188.1 2-oxoglutarate ferredoxin oxidoreductase subunit alpha [Catalinimonas alkaloidigena]
MRNGAIVNDMVVRFANVNGTGSASANEMFAKAIFRMGIPVTPKNIFPSNIQGLPTWYEVRINEHGYLGRREGIDLLVGVNPQSYTKDIESIRPGGYFVYDNTKRLHPEFFRADIQFIGIPMMRLCMEHFQVPRQQQLFKNIVYVGALAALLDLELTVVQDIIRDQFGKKPKLIDANFLALDLGYQYAKENYECPLDIRVERRDAVGDQIMIDGNTATALGAIYAGCTVAAWYPITPSTSVVKAFEDYAKKLRVDPETGKNLYALVQAEDELAAIGMVIGATWNGARAFTATSGPGVSLMSEFLGLAYFAEIPVVLVNVQRGGPSTGMPTRTQQADLISSAYASHGDTKQVLLFPSTPAECFDMTVDAFDLAERLQTPVILMSDLDLGMNSHLSPPLAWDDARAYDRGKVLDAAALDEIETFGRYLDVDGDGICYRTIPGTHPTKGAFFTRGTSRDEYARYTEDGDVNVRILNRMLQKWETAKAYVPAPELYQEGHHHDYGLIFFGTSSYATLEAMDRLEKQGIRVDAMRVRAFPFNHTVEEFIAEHERVFVIEQNRDKQFRSLLVNELEIHPKKLISILNYNGMPITAGAIMKQIQQELPTVTTTSPVNGQLKH